MAHHTSFGKTKLFTHPKRIWNLHTPDHLRTRSDIPDLRRVLYAYQCAVISDVINLRLYFFDRGYVLFS